MLAAMGEDLRTIGELIGHKDFRTTQRVYAHLGSSKLQKASERIAGKVEELLTAPSP
jgi:site-specific recombinase XerD